MQKARQSFYGLPGFSSLAARKPWRHRLPLPCWQVAQAGAAAAAGGAGGFALKRRKGKSGDPPLAAAGHYCLPVRPGPVWPFWLAPCGGKQRGRAQGGQQRQAAPLPRMAAAAVRAAWAGPRPWAGFAGPPCPAPGVPAAFTAKESVTFALAPPLPEMVSVSPYLPAPSPVLGGR